MSDSIKKLQNLFSKFPTIGSRTASRFVFYLLSLPNENLHELANAILEIKSNIKFCNFCFNPFEGQENLCQICQNKSRDNKLLCIVEKEADLISIEKTKKYNGFYFILGGVLSLRKNNAESLRIVDLKERVLNPQKFGIDNNFKEIIIAINPTPEGRSTSLLVEKSLKDIPNAIFTITHLATGLPFGGELEYADDETLGSAFEGRK